MRAKLDAIDAYVYEFNKIFESIMNRGGPLEGEVERIEQIEQEIKKLQYEILEEISND